MTISAGSTITSVSYNDVQSIIKKILNPSSTGYGPNLLSSTTASNRIVASRDHFFTLYDDVNRAIIHQTGASMVNVDVPTVGAVISATFINNLATSATIAILNSSTVHPSQLAQYLDSSIVTATNWGSSDIAIAKNYTWDTVLEADYHFNLGGSILTTFGYNGAATSPEDTAFKNFVDQVNTSSIFLSAYDRSNWLGYGSKTTEFSTLTAAGVFTATVSYSAAGSTVSLESRIKPPSGLSDVITLDVISSSTLYVSTGSIKAELPTLVVNRKILSVSGLSLFTFQAGDRSNPQTLTIDSIGSEPVTISSIAASNNGVFGFVASTSTGFVGDFVNPVPIAYPVVIPAGDSFQATVYYLSDPNSSLGQIGQFDNTITINSDATRSSIVVPTTQVLTNPDFDFDLRFVNNATLYTVQSWADEYGITLTAGNLAVVNGIRAYYTSNTDYGIINGKRRYGLYRQPDAQGLYNWYTYTQTSKGGDWTQILTEFFTSVDVSSQDYPRSLTLNKAFDQGYGFGDFYDKTLVDTNINSALPVSFTYRVFPKFGSVISFGSPVLSNWQYEGSSSAQAQAAFSADFGGFTAIGDYRLQFNPVLINSTGTYSVDLTVSVTAFDLNGATVTKSKTVDFTTEVLSLPDVNLAQWRSPIGQENAIMGLSYDRIGGTRYLTVGIGQGCDGAVPLYQTNYFVYSNVNYLGLQGDPQFVPYSTHNTNTEVPFWQSGYTSYAHQFYYPLYKVSSPDQQWGSFLNTYGVWFRYRNFFNGFESEYPDFSTQSYTGSYVFSVGTTGSYTIEFSSSVWGTYLIFNQKGAQIDGIDYFSGPGSSYIKTGLQLTQGEKYVVKLQARELAKNISFGIALTVRTDTGNLVWSTLNPVRPTNLPAYVFWQEVYRIPILTTGTISDISKYRVKKDTDLYFRFSGFGDSWANQFENGFPFNVIHDGQGNLSFTWNRPTRFPTSWSSINGRYPNEYADYLARTVGELEHSQYLVSNLKGRISNLSDPGLPAGQTRRLIGLKAQGGPSYDVVTIPGTLVTPGLADNVYIEGVPASGRGPTINPGRQYNFSRTAYWDVNIAPITQNYYSNESGNFVFSGNKPLAMLNPKHVFTKSQIEQFGISNLPGYGNILVGEQLTITQINVRVDYDLVILYGYRKIWEKWNDASSKLGGVIYQIQDRVPFRQFYTQNFNFTLPEPSINEILVVEVADSQGGLGDTPRGFDSLQIYYTYNKIVF